MNQNETLFWNRCIHHACS